MYSHPTFIFEHYASHVLFSALILSQRFHAIRSIRIMHTDQTYSRIGFKSSGKASYRLLRQKGVFVRNSDLPSLRQPDWPKWSDREAKKGERTPALNEWQHICLIMCAMQGLRKFRLDVHETAYLGLHRLGGCGSNTTFWDDMTNFFESRVSSDGFEIVFNQPLESVQAFVGRDLADLGFVRGRGG